MLLSSYSPASIVNSFVRDARRISLREKTDYVAYIGTNCRLLNADYFMPFASQVIFKRTDSAWANDFKVTFTDLERNCWLLMQVCPFLLKRVRFAGLFSVI